MEQSTTRVPGGYRGVRLSQPEPRTSGDSSRLSAPSPTVRSGHPSPLQADGIRSASHRYAPAGCMALQQIAQAGTSRVNSPAARPCAAPLDSGGIHHASEVTARGRQLCASVYTEGEGKRRRAHSARSSEQSPRARTAAVARVAPVPQPSRQLSAPVPDASGLASSSQPPEAGGRQVKAKMEASPLPAAARCPTGAPHATFLPRPRHGWAFPTPVSEQTPKYQHQNSPAPRAHVAAVPAAGGSPQPPPTAAPTRLRSHVWGAPSPPDPTAGTIPGPTKPPGSGPQHHAASPRGYFKAR
ncbi:hypothetical protein LUU34_00409900 [Aix galericulata]|nr:hypothetical protein LUU34_00409900 [Aix galericulata]